MIELYLQWPTNRKSYNYGLSNGAIFSDLEQTLTQFSSSYYSLSLNISQTAKYTLLQNANRKQ